MKLRFVYKNILGVHAGALEIYLAFCELVLTGLEISGLLVVTHTVITLGAFLYNLF